MRLASDGCCTGGLGLGRSAVVGDLQVTVSLYVELKLSYW